RRAGLPIERGDTENELDLVLPDPLG
ncbi:MAG: hypothetical protein QOG96_4170, partial [Pseudonocardiales bacterium]|nr:hypothetical protein [Pseudonocardiales bacterium]